MFYLLCYRKDEFYCRAFFERDLATKLAEFLIKHHYFDRVVLAEYLSECIVDDQD